MATLIGLLVLAVIGFSEFADFAVLLALVAGILELVPIIGPIIAAVPAILIGASISPAAALAAVALYTIIQQVENHLLVPKVMGDAVDLHPAVGDPLPDRGRVTLRAVGRDPRRTGGCDRSRSVPLRLQTLDGGSPGGRASYATTGTRRRVPAERRAATGQGPDAQPA